MPSSTDRWEGGRIPKLCPRLCPATPALSSVSEAGSVISTAYGNRNGCVQNRDAHRSDVPPHASHSRRVVPLPPLPHVPARSHGASCVRRCRGRAYLHGSARLRSAVLASLAPKAMSAVLSETCRRHHHRGRRRKGFEATRCQCARKRQDSQRKPRLGRISMPANLVGSKERDDIRKIRQFGPADIEVGCRVHVISRDLEISAKRQPSQQYGLVTANAVRNLFHKP